MRLFYGHKNCRLGGYITVDSAFDEVNVVVIRKGTSRVSIPQSAIFGKKKKKMSEWNFLSYQWNTKGNEDDSKLWMWHGES